MEKRKLLVVEDDTATARVLEKTVRTLGLEVVVVDTVALAKDILENETIDLCVTDIGLPGGESGIDLLKFIRNSSKLKKLPVIVHSGMLRKPNPEIEKYAPDAVFQKPASMTDLAAEITRLLSKK